jgi:hypothetical protein
LTVDVGEFCIDDPFDGGGGIALDLACGEELVVVFVGGAQVDVVGHQFGIRALRRVTISRVVLSCFSPNAVLKETMPPRSTLSLLNLD